nr:matrixin family metalloprotease [Thermococcus sp. 18S1]
MYFWALLSPATLEYFAPPNQEIEYQVGNPRPIYFYDVDPSSCTEKDRVEIEAALEYLSKNTGVKFVRLPYPIASSIGGIGYRCTAPSIKSALGEESHGLFIFSIFIFTWSNVRIPSGHLARDIILHETLHAMGLGHNNDPQSIMYPYVTGNDYIEDRLIKFISRSYYKNPLAYLNIIPRNIVVVTFFILFIRANRE